MPNNLLIPPKQVLNHYKKRKLGEEELSELLEVDIDTIRSWYDHHGIKRLSFRSWKGNATIEKFYPIDTLEKREQSRAVLEGLLRFRSEGTIAKQCGVTTKEMRNFIKGIGAYKDPKVVDDEKRPSLMELYTLFKLNKESPEWVAKHYEVTEDHARGWSIMIDEYAKLIKKLK